MQGELMKTTYKMASSVAIGTAIAATLMLGLGLSADAQTPPPAASQAPSATAAQQAIKARKAVYTLIANSFGPLSTVAQGKAPYDNADALKRAERLSVLAAYVPDVFPEISNGGETKAKPEIWSNRADFDQRSKQLLDDANALLRTVKQDGKESDTFKNAVSTVAKDCKGCHDLYRAS
jgi:cytochrome c556